MRDLLLGVVFVGIASGAMAGGMTTSTLHGANETSVAVVTKTKPTSHAMYMELGEMPPQYPHGHAYMGHYGSAPPSPESARVPDPSKINSRKEH